MELNYGRPPGLCVPLVLLLLRLAAPSVAELTTSILRTPVLELRQATSTTDTQATPTTGDDSLPSSTGSSTTGSPSSTSTGSADRGGDDGMSDDEGPTHAFNFYFLLIAIFIAILLLGFAFAGRRRKRRALMIMQSRHQALRRDVEGYPGRQPNNSRNPTGGGQTRLGTSRWAANWRTRNEPGVTRHDEGLDELGEAPPPYNPSDKPPSISVRRASNSSERGAGDDAGLTVPLRTLSRGSGGANPPEYRECAGHDTSEDSAEITRPEAVATTTPATPGRAEQSGSDRRLLEETETSH